MPILINTLLVYIFICNVFQPIKLKYYVHTTGYPPTIVNVVSKRCMQSSAKIISIKQIIKYHAMPPLEMIFSLKMYGIKLLYFSLIFYELRVTESLTHMFF